MPRRARAAKGPACKTEIRGCKSRRRVHFGVVVLIAARRARNAEETERNRPAPPIFAREVFTDARLPSKQGEPARYRPRAPWVLDVRVDGLVSKTDREGASPSGPASFGG